MKLGTAPTFSPAKPARPGTAPTSSAASAYRSAVVRAVIAATDALAAARGGAVGRRRLVNFLRGNQLPPPAVADSGAMALFGLLESHAAGWVGEAVERLVEEGYLTLAAGRGGVPGGIAVSRSGKVAARESASLPADVLPARPRLGASPEVEDRLRALRRKLAAAEGRAPYSVFPNGVLAELAAKRPRTLADLASIPGMGEARVRKYGRRILGAFN